MLTALTGAIRSRKTASSRMLLQPSNLKEEEELKNEEVMLKNKVYRSIRTSNESSGKTNLGDLSKHCFVLVKSEKTKHFLTKDDVFQKKMGRKKKKRKKNGKHS